MVVLENFSKNEPREITVYGKNSRRTITSLKATDAKEELRTKHRIQKCRIETQHRQQCSINHKRSVNLYFIGLTEDANLLFVFLFRV